jgi:soluble lytic murein transglycosylase-like protein
MKFLILFFILTLSLESNDFSEIIRKECSFDLDTNLVKAIIKLESNWNPNAHYKGCYGLMQVQGGSFKPELNIKQGCRKLRVYLRLSGGNLELALTYYNFGVGKAKKLKLKTSKYAKRILNKRYN